MSQQFLPGVWPPFLKPAAEQLSHIYHYVSPIAEGKNGSTHKLQRIDSQRFYCLKTIKPDSPKAEFDDAVDSLKKEIAILDPLAHRCLPCIYERRLDGSTPFYVCTYHPGETFESFKKAGRRLSREKALFVIGALIDAFQYIHEQGRTHCDFHQKNVLIHEDVFANGVLIVDFGSGHRDSDPSASTIERGDLRFKDVPAQTHFREHVSRDVASSGFRLQDFKAFGHSLALMFEVFFHDAPNDQRIAYLDFCAMLESGRYDTWRDVRDAFALVIDPQHLVSGADRYFIMADGTRKFIRLPVVDDVPIGEAVLAVVNTRCFQRLRSLKQLSFCDWMYPGATHSRFEHSLGSMRVMHDALQRLSLTHEFRSHFTRQNVEGALLAGLLHDIGHYPFAHVMEQYVASRFTSSDNAEEKERNQRAKRIVSHRDYGIELLSSNTELTDIIDKYWGRDQRMEAIRIIDGKVPVLSELLDGPIDCDKLDYLRRDAYHCGVRYGQGLDVASIVSAFCCVANATSLGITDRGIHAVEGLMIAQEQMLGTVYWHATIRAVTAMFHAAVARIVLIELPKLEAFVAALKSCQSEQEAVVKVLLPEIGRLEKEKIIREGELSPLLALHVTPQWEIYRPIARYSQSDGVPVRSAALRSIFSEIVELPNTGASGVPINWKAIGRLRSCYLAAFEEKRHSNNAQVGQYDVLIDVPWGKASNRVVTVRQAGGSEHAITAVSHLKDTVFLQPTAFLAPIRVYISPRVYEAYEDRLRSVIQSAEEKFYQAERR